MSAIAAWMPALLKFTRLKAYGIHWSEISNIKDWRAMLQVLMICMRQTNLSNRLLRFDGIS